MTHKDPEQEQFNRFMDRKRQTENELVQKFGLTKSGYYWVRFKGDESEGEPDDEDFSLCYFDLEGSMTQTARTFHHCGRDLNLEHVKEIGGFVEKPKRRA